MFLLPPSSGPLPASLKSVNFYRITRRSKSGGKYFHKRRCDNLKSHEKSWLNASEFQLQRQMHKNAFFLLTIHKEVYDFLPTTLVLCHKQVQLVTACPVSKEFDADSGTSLKKLSAVRHAQQQHTHFALTFWTFLFRISLRSYPVSIRISPLWLRPEP
jgi:hypothetical protein